MARKKRVDRYFPLHVEEGFAVVSPSGNVMKWTIRDSAEASRMAAERHAGLKWRKMCRDGCQCRRVGVAVVPSPEERRTAAALAKRQPVKKGAKR